MLRLLFILMLLCRTIIYSEITVIRQYLLNMQMPYVNDVLRIFRERGHIQEFSKIKHFGAMRLLCEWTLLYLKKYQGWGCIGLPIGHDVDLAISII